MIKTVQYKRYFLPNDIFFMFSRHYHIGDSKKVTTIRKRDPLREASSRILRLTREENVSPGVPYH